MGDEVFIQSPNGENIGPVKSSVQRNKVFIRDEKLAIEEGGKILRTLPNGKSESYSILQVDFFKDPGGKLSHYEILVRKEASLVPTPLPNVINISNCQGVQVGDYNIQNIAGALEELAQALDSSKADPEQRTEAKGLLKALLKHPVTVAVIGATTKKVLDSL